MNKESKTSMKTIVRYIRDFSIVVAGIAVTLYVNYRVTNQGEKRDLKLYLNAIKLEMEENITYLDQKVEVLQNSVEYANYLMSNEKESISRDSVMFFIRQGDILEIHDFTFKTNAFDMFKTSGTMRLIEDKDLLLSIWNAYAGLNSAKAGLDMLMSAKWDEAKNLQPLFEKGADNIIPLYTFYRLGMAHEASRVCKETVAVLKETVEKLEKQ